jgi:hypothetical protein
MTTPNHDFCTNRTNHGPDFAQRMIVPYPHLRRQITEHLTVLISKPRILSRTTHFLWITIGLSATR